MSPAFGDTTARRHSAKQTPALACFTMPRGLHRYQQCGDLHFVTFSCYHRFPHLASPEAATLLDPALEAVRRRYGVAVLGYVVMPEHVHLLVT